LDCACAFDQPEQFLHTARNFCEQIGGVRVPGLSRCVDCRARQYAECRVADMNRVLQIKLLGQRREIIGIRIHVVTVPRLARLAMPAPVVRDAPIAARSEKEHLVFKRVSAQRPAVAEHNRLPRSPIPVMNLRAVFGDECHVCSP